ncbi:MAG TPA: tetratricopeptide repeat protein [Thermoanaerobaculia bacterium]|nr:tetratricopeptide repeat protein [Thermoanaerobaculia bacterium]
MKAFVFTDKALARRTGQFVWLAIDTEKALNASFLAKFPVQVWPSFYVLDPASETVALRWVGGATVPQLQKILDDGQAAVRGRGRGFDEALARADKLYGQDRNAEAAQAYREALAKAPRGWPRYARTVESLLFALQAGHEKEACAKTAREAFERLRKTSSAANVASSGLDCALALPVENPERKELVAALEEDARQVLAQMDVPVAADDRSSVFISLLDTRENAKDEEGRKNVASQWASFLEGEAAKAKTPEGRAVFDSHRLSAYLALQQPERAIPMLEASERDLPDDYNPSARLAAAYKAMKRYDEALAASDRAIAKAYGPRKLLILQTRADIYTARGDAAAARRTLEQALETAESFPPGQRSETTIAAIKKKLEGMP